MKQQVYFWVERYLFTPDLLQKLLSLLLLPLTALYCLVVIVKRTSAKPKNLGIPVISIGNLIVGGSGKTPLAIALAEELSYVGIVLRGYKRASKGLVVVSQYGVITSSVDKSGDEAMLFAKSLPKATVIVCEDRQEGILKAKSLGAKVVLLDDGFSKSGIEKFDILIKPSQLMPNRFCLPSGPYREGVSHYKKADLVVTEGIDFQRQVNIKNPTDRMVLVTAISKPQRLDRYLPDFIEKVYYPDHYEYHGSELETIMRKYSADSILTTQKDAVKMENFRIDLSILELNLQLKPMILEEVNKYIEDFGKIS
ncbi:MAG: tetraacyldisaccharide 4'-kinase [Epsilonproteobacteria bacterium]|nr:tetraacyldisaccharide 4'-kinase [Campylobacterota bacterium]